ncbi:GDSL-type esterase/lipase family protein [Streptodolium elevatio]
MGLDLVGPKGTLENARIAGGGEDHTYADPHFGTDHDAQWGRPLSDETHEIEARGTIHTPKYLLVLLGINDLFWHHVAPSRFEVSLRMFLEGARRADAGIRIVLGRMLPTHKAAQDPVFAARVAACDDRIGAVAAELGTEQSPIVVAATDRVFVAADHTWDGTHPNLAGELRIAAAFADALAGDFGIGARYPRPFLLVPDIPRSAKAPID